MTDKEKTGNLFDRLKYHSWVLVLLWTGCIAASLLWNLYEQREKILEMARNSAQITFENDVLYRRWAAKQGGIYVPVSEQIPPNPYLNVPDRDITTSSGLSLTLVNPAYMARQVNQMAADIHGSQSHLTSLKPIRPENSPDPWEAAALKSFERGMKEVSSVEKIADEEYMRLMRPFVAEKACLKCHALQGYKEGDIRGGISVSVPMAPLSVIERPLIKKISLAHLLLWIVGMAGIVISKRGLEKQILARERTEAVLSESENKLRIVADFTYDWEYWRSTDDRFLYVSPSCERITGHAREEFIQDPGLYSRIIHPDDRERVVTHLREGRFGRQLCELEFRIVRRDGKERWIGHACQPVLDANGQSLGRRASDRDITERKRAEEALQQLNTELEQRVEERTEELAEANKALRQLSIRLLSAHEEERKRIAGELHDTIGACLSGIKFKVEDTLQRIGKNADVEAKSLKTIVPVIQEAVEECRRIQMDLRPSMLDDLGLLPTLSWFSRRFQAIYSGIRVDQEVMIEESDVPASLKIVIYRVIQEAINNVAKHSKADLVRLCLRKIDGGMEVTVEDNGQGFDLEKMPNAESAKRGLGLTSMRERAELSGGSFHIESTVGKGTIIRARWPI
jgi:two-component system, chemotaxis family, sensor kinase Cph1